MHAARAIARELAVQPAAQLGPLVRNTTRRLRTGVATREDALQLHSTTAVVTAVVTGRWATTMAGLGALLLLLYEANSSPSNSKPWCVGPEANHNTSNFGDCDVNASTGYYPLPKESRHPVMFVPSMIGSNLYRKLHNSHEPYPICPNGGYFGGGGNW